MPQMDEHKELRRKWMFFLYLLLLFLLVVIIIIIINIILRFSQRHPLDYKGSASLRWLFFIQSPKRTESYSFRWSVVLFCFVLFCFACLFVCFCFFTRFLLVFVFFYGLFDCGDGVFLCLVWRIKRPIRRRRRSLGCTATPPTRRRWTSTSRFGARATGTRAAYKLGTKSTRSRAGTNPDV